MSEGHIDILRKKMREHGFDLSTGHESVEVAMSAMAEAAALARANALIEAARFCDESQQFQLTPRQLAKDLRAMAAGLDPYNNAHKKPDPESIIPPRGRVEFVPKEDWRNELAEIFESMGTLHGRIDGKEKVTLNFLDQIAYALRRNAREAEKP